MTIKSKILREPDKGGTTGATVAEPEKIPALGSAFSGMLTSMEAAENAPAAAPAAPEAAKEAEKAPPPAAAKEAAPRIEDALAGAPAAPKDDAKPVVIEDEVKGMSPAAASNWKTLRGSYEAKISAIAAENAKLKETSEKAVRDREQKLSALQKERDEMATALEKIGVERSPQFINKFEKGRAAIVGRAESLVKRYGGTEGEIAAALKLPPDQQAEALEEAVAPLTEFQRQQIASLLTEVATLDDEREKFLTNAKQNLTVAQEDELRQQQEQNAGIIAARQARFDEVASSLIRPLPDDHPNAAETNPIVADVRAKAADFLFNNSNFDAFAEAAVAYAVRPVLIQRITAQQSQIAELQKQLSEMSAAQDMSGGNAGAAGSATQESGSFAERFQKAAEKLSGAAAA